MAGYGFGSNPYSNPGYAPQGTQPVSSFLQTIASQAQQLSEQQYQWGLQQFAHTSQITDANIQNYLEAASKAMGLATNNIQRYEQLFQPQENALIQDANTYNSKERQALEMGAAEAKTGQAMEAGRANALRDLQSYGIDPSAGRYAGLDMAERAQAAAAQAGAAQQARQATEATGRALRAQAIQVGQQYPGQAVNALNVGLSGLAGSENAVLANANTGVNLTTSPLGYLNTAAGLKYPPQATPGHPATPSQSPSSGPGGAIPSGPGAPSWGAPASAPAAAGPGPTFLNNPYFTGATPTGASPWDESGFQNVDYTQTQQQQPASSWDESGFQSSYEQAPQQDYSYSQQEPYQEYQPPQQDYYDYGETAYAGGGAIPDAPTTGGQVPPQASPSQGQQTDDVNARLNVNEFVIPRDVALWKGQEFFQKLIAQSRKARVTAPAHGKSGPAQPGPVRFASQAAG